MEWSSPCISHHFQVPDPFSSHKTIYKTHKISHESSRIIIKPWYKSSSYGKKNKLIYHNHHNPPIFHGPPWFFPFLHLDAVHLPLLLTGRRGLLQRHRGGAQRRDGDDEIPGEVHAADVDQGRTQENPGLKGFLGTAWNDVELAGKVGTFGRLAAMK